MINYKYLYIVILFSMMFASCDNRFEEMNTNPNSITDLSDEYLFADVVRYTMLYGIHTDFPFSSEYAEIFVCGGQMKFADAYYDNFTTNEYQEAFNFPFYNGIRNGKEALRLTQKGGDYENQLHEMMIKVMLSINYTKLADTFGAVPYFEGGWGQTGMVYPKYDQVETIYKDMIAVLDTCYQIISKGDPKNGYEDFDPLYENDLSKWSRMANSWRFLLAMRCRFVDPSYAEPIIKECLTRPLIEENDQNLMYECEDRMEGEFNNPIFNTYEYWKFKISDRLVKQLHPDGFRAIDDPRLPIFVRKTSSKLTPYVGLPNGLSDEEYSKYNLQDISDPTDTLVGRGANVYLLTASMVYLLRSEAALFDIGDGDPQELYQAGIEKSMEQWGIIPDDYNDFLDSKKLKIGDTKEQKFKEISTQYWVASIPSYLEAYSNIRRTGYPVIDQREAPINDLGVTNGILPTRFRYPDGEVNMNSENVNKAISIQGPDKIDTKLWWDIRD